MNNRVMCTLEVAINTCPHYDSESRTCTANETACSFRKAGNEPAVKRSTEYRREPRWYEQYYRN